MVVPFGAWSRKVLLASFRGCHWCHGVLKIPSFYFRGEVEICQVSRVLLSSRHSLPLSWFLVFSSTSLNKEKNTRDETVPA